MKKGWIPPYLVLLIEQLLHTVFLVKLESRLAQMIHKAEDGSFLVPEWLTDQELNPELQHCSWSNTIGMAACENMTLPRQKSSTINAASY